MYRLYQNSPLSSHPVVALSELSTLCVGPCPDERTFYLVLLQLQKEKRVTVLEQNGEKVWRSAGHPLTPDDSLRLCRHAHQHSCLGMSPCLREGRQ